MGKEFQKIVAQGIALLKSQKFYTRAAVVRKLRSLGVETTEPTLSNIVNNKRSVGLDTLSEVKDGILTLVQKELAFGYKDKIFMYDKTLEPTSVIAEYQENDPGSGFQFYGDGRLSIEEKVAFFSTAQKEIVEFGVTLNTFSNYFLTRREAEFKEPIRQLLEDGVTLKCYLLDPQSNEALHYFNDRAKSLPDEAQSIEKIKSALLRLHLIQNELASSGKVEIYLYKHIPYNYFLIVDGESTFNAKMAVSHYLYGQRRAHAPVFTFKKLDNRDLFRRYYQSYQALAKNAKLYDPTIKSE